MDMKNDGFLKEPSCFCPTKFATMVVCDAPAVFLNLWFRAQPVYN